MSKRPGRGWWWLLWPWALCAEPRDPFAPPPLPACAQTAASPAGWRLKGVIGQPTLRYGWVVTPAGQWLRLRTAAGAGRALAGDAGAGAQPDVNGAGGRTGLPGEPGRHLADNGQQGW